MLTKKWTLFYLLLFVFYPVQMAAQINLVPTASVSCEEILNHVRETLDPVIRDMTSKDSAVIQVGVYKDIRKLALESGMDRPTAIQAVKAIETALEQNRGRDTVLGTTFNYLEKLRKDDAKLLICVMTGNCHLPAGTFFIPDESELRLAQINVPRAQSPLAHRIPHLILMNGGAMPYLAQGIPGPSGAVAMTWAIDFLTGATSMADYELIKEWIAANTALLKAGERSDELFDRYARIIPTLRVDIGFYRALSSSRATAATLGVVPGAPEAGLRDETMAEIRRFPKETQSIIEHYNLTSANIIEFGQIATKQMMETIRRAGKL